MRGLINIEINDNECFRLCLVRYLNPVHINPTEIKNVQTIIKSTTCTLRWFWMCFSKTTDKSYNDPNTEQHQDHVVCICGYKLICAAEQYS